MSIAHPQDDRNVVPVGLPGAGKSTVGRILARWMGRKFIDTDVEIEGRTGKQIAQLFLKLSEPAFRELERRVAAEAVNGRGRAIAFGGGTFIDGETRALVQRGCTSIWLDVPFDELLERLRSSPPRPLFVGRDDEAALREISADRLPILAEAHFRISADSVDQAVEAILRALTGRRQDAGR